MSLRSVKRFCRLVSLHTTRKELNTLVASSRFVTLHRGIVKPTGLSRHISIAARCALIRRRFPIPSALGRQTEAEDNDIGHPKLPDSS